MLFVKQLELAYLQQLNTLVLREIRCVLESEIMNLFSFIVDTSGRHVSASDNGKRIVSMDYGVKSFGFMCYNRNDSGTCAKNPTK